MGLCQPIKVTRRHQYSWTVSLLAIDKPRCMSVIHLRSSPEVDRDFYNVRMVYSMNYTQCLLNFISLCLYIGPSVFTRLIIIPQGCFISTWTTGNVRLSILLNCMDIFLVLSAFTWLALIRQGQSVKHETCAYISGCILYQVPWISDFDICQEDRLHFIVDNRNSP